VGGVRFPIRWSNGTAPEGCVRHKPDGAAVTSRTTQEPRRIPREVVAAFAERPAPSAADKRIPAPVSNVTARPRFAASGRGSSSRGQVVTLGARRRPPSSSGERRGGRAQIGRAAHDPRSRRAGPRPGATPRCRRTSPSRARARGWVDRPHGAPRREKRSRAHLRSHSSSVAPVAIQPGSSGAYAE
jgi:hypothetical protein